MMRDGALGLVAARGSPLAGPRVRIKTHVALKLRRPLLGGEVALLLGSLLLGEVG